MNAALGGAKDGEGRASAAELIFGDLIDSHESARQTAGKNAGRSTGCGEQEPNFQK